MVNIKGKHTVLHPCSFLSCFPMSITESPLFPFWFPSSMYAAAAAAAKSLQSCPNLCDLVDSSPPGSAVPGILQARTLEWVAISFFNAWKWSRSVVSDS